MAKPDLSFAGFLYDDSGDAINGATINLYTKNATSTSLANTTTNASGYWAISHTPASGETGEYDVQITSGASKRRIKFDDAAQLASLDTEVFSVRGNEGAAAAYYMFADEGEDAGDRWKVNVADGGVMTFGNDINSQNTYVTHLTITPNSTVASSTVAIAGHLDVDGTANLDAVDIDGAIQADGTVTVGVDDTGYDVKFFGASAGAFMIYDQSEDQLQIMGASADATTSTGKILLSTSLTDINANDVIGKIDFQAPLEAGGTDAITVSASIQAIAQSTFAADSNATDLIFYTGHSEAATEKFRFTSQGELGIGGATYGSSGDVLTSGGAGAAPTWATPTTGDITGVTAGVGLSGGGSSGGVTLTLDLSELSTVTPADGDFFSTLDSDGANEQKTTTTALATLFAGTVTSTGISASSSVLTLDIQNMTASTTIADADLVVVDDGAGGTLRKMTRANFIESAALDAINIDGGAIDGAVIGANSAAAITGTTITANTSIIPDAVGGADIGSTSAEWGDVFIADDKAIKFGDGQDATIEYDEDGTDQLRISGATVFEDNMEVADSKFLEFASAAGTPTTDNTVQGVVIEFLATEAITQFDAVYVSTTTGRVGRADANDAAKLPAIGIAIEAQGSAGSSVRVLTHGVYRDDGGFGGNMTVGTDLYVSETPGTLTDTAPGDDGDFVQLMGVAVGVRSAFINPDLTIIEVA